MSIPSTKQRDLDFLEACKTKNCHNVRQFIHSGCDPILVQNECGQNALHVASLHGNTDVVELLVKVYGCNPAIIDHEGRTALHLACMGGSTVVTNYLMKMVNCHLKDNSGNTILHYACLSGDVPTLRFVMDVITERPHISDCKLNIYRDKSTLYFNGPNVSRFIALENRSGETALHTAFRAGHLNILLCVAEEIELDRCLLRIFASLSDLACQYGRYDVFTRLVHSKCSHTTFFSPTKPFTVDDFTPGYLVFMKTMEEQLKSFKAITGDLNTKSFYYEFSTPTHHLPLPNFKNVSFRARALNPSLRFACQAGNEEMVRHLIEEYNSNPLLPDSDTGDTPLHFACISGNVSLVSFLLNCQRDSVKCSMKRNKQGNLPLHEACKWGYFEIVEKLIDIEPSAINARNQVRETPLHLACSRNRIRIGKLLVSIDGCDVMALNHLKETPLHVASCSSDYDVIECILNRNKDALMCVDSYGDTPLFNACRVGDVNVVKLFVDTFCDLLYVNKRTGELPIHIACRTGNMALYECLKSCMNSEAWNQANILGQTPLHLVCEQGNFHIVNDILEHDSCDLNWKNKKGMTPLHIVCKKSNAEIAKIILAQPRVDVIIEDEDGNTPLHLACVSENSNIVTLLMQNEPDVTIVNKNGDTPIHLASKSDKFQVFRGILGTNKHGLKFEFNNAGVTPLHIASSNGNFEMVKALVSRQYCNPNATSKQENCTPLHFACFEGHKDIAMYLAQCAPQTIKAYDVRSRIPLVLALQKENFDVIKSLVPQYFDPNSRVPHEDVPFFLQACYYGDIDLLKYLVSEANCNLITEVPPWGSTLHFVIHCIDPLEEKFIYILNVCSSQIGCANGDGDTPLLLACKLGKDRVVTMFLEHNADPNCKNSAGHFPLHIACRSQRCDIVETLLRYSADSSCKDSSGNTPLHIASGAGKTELVRLLLDHEANLSCKNSEGKTPIQVATSYDVTMILIDYGANPQDVYTHYGEVLEMCKQEQPLHDTVRILVVGNAFTGKTTLVEALKKEDIPVALIDNVTERTAGIVSTQFRSDKLGYVTFHDFAGQQEFYSSHSQFLVSNLSSDAIVLLLVNAMDEDSELVKIVSYWMSFIKDHCSSVDCLPQLVVICSHLDKLDNGKNVKESLLKQAIQKHECFGPVFLDCRNPVSEGMCELKDLLGGICDKVRSNIELDCQCHILFTFMHTRFRDTVELCEVQRAISETRKNDEVQRAISEARKNDNVDLYNDDLYNDDLYDCVPFLDDTIKKDSRDPGGLLPLAAHLLLNLLQALHKKGHILLLKEESQENEYWIVLKQNEFYEIVHGTLFAPTNFIENGPIPNTGVVPLSVLEEIFFQYTTDMKLIANYLVYKEFCHKIDDQETLQLINNETNPMLGSDDELYFFPCFVKVEKQSTVWKQRREQLYSLGWCLECRDEHFTNNFLHVLLLRLTFKYAASHEHVASSSHLSRRCNIWKNGIHWFTTEGVEVLVELTHNHTFLLVLIRSLDDNMTMECVKLRASVIRTVFDVLEKTCPGLKPSESLIHSDLQNYPHCDLIFAEKIDIQAVAETIMKGHPFSHSSSNEPIKLEKLLFFEPYCGIGKYLSLLFENNEEEMPSNYVLQLSQCFSSRKDKLAYMLNVSPVDMGDIKALPVCQKNPELIPHRIIEHWKISTQRGSFSDLKQAFDDYSIFKGRNPLTLCN